MYSELDIECASGGAAKSSMAAGAAVLSRELPSSSPIRGWLSCDFSCCACRAHDLEPLRHGRVLVLVWEKKSRAEALAAGRHPELIPDGEVWNNLVVEIAGGDGTSTRLHRGVRLFIIWPSSTSHAWARFASSST